MGIREEVGFMQWLLDSGYVAPKPLMDRPGHYAAILRLIYTHAIITGPVGDTTMYADRWCYETEGDARKALDAWNGAGEPEGWHRHPSTGRRRPGADSMDEYINP